MLKLKLEAVKKTSFFRFSSSLEIRARFSREENYSASFIGSFSEHLLEALSAIYPWIKYYLKDTVQLNNLRGRYYLSAGHNEDLIRVPDGQEELLYFQGQFNLKNEDETELDILPFAARLASRFEKFSANSIVYKTETTLNGQIEQFANQLAWSQIPLISNAEIHYFRVGLETFRSRSFGWAFGLVPVLASSFILEANADEITLVCKLEKITNDQRTEDTAILALDQALRATCLYHNFLQEMEILRRGQAL